MHPINSVKGAITTGVVIAIVIGIVLVHWTPAPTPVTFHPVRADRWLHILSGVMWIGLLYCFNVGANPGLAAARGLTREVPTVRESAKPYRAARAALVPLVRGIDLAHPQRGLT